MATIAINAAVSYWVYTRHRGTRGRRWFVATLVLGILWMGFHLAHLLSADRTVEWIGSIVSGKVGILSVLTYVVFASRYSRADFHRRLEVRVLMGVAVGIV
ncbi:histidine kinase N-terminal 7TM domain-containing protein [Halorientalis pallida]|uniref:Histidine kinase N-terminal 7TM region domain-containing protein n=1 Tax=Halorientalis pallida TaxID=2479928 RepID=A0A498KV10_9EURY|nr:histidine kinase N-terminal 7TM domain-containing protein [Halorientalis pallida]RXK46311.1 hypothetical protein EAF64_19735 [Halorientalis pallida]